MTQTLKSTLRRVQFLQDASEEFLDRLLPVARTISVPTGGVLFRQGDVARSFYLMIEGHVALEVCAPAVGCKRILTVEPGEILGWSPVLGQPRMTATARAFTDVLTIELDAAGSLTICENEPRFGYELMRRTAIALAKRLNATRLQLLNVYGDEMPPVPDERVAR